VRVTVIGTGFDQRYARGRAGRGARGERAGRPDRGPRIDERQLSTLEISEDEIDVPPFLR
jgi:cell division protein FtsZ